MATASSAGGQAQGPQPPSQPTLCVCGTYDGGIVGWELQEHGAGKERLKMVFAYTPHQGSVRALAMPKEGRKAGLLLASGGSDEHIRMYDLRKRAEAGELLHHKGTVTCLGFVGSSHLLSGSDDGTVCIWRVYDWSLLHILGGHKGPVTALAIHPSGKLALTAGRDRALRLWDLVNGRCAYITKLESPAESIKWSDDGAAYALVLGAMGKRLEVRRAADNAVTASVTHPLRVTAVAFLPPPPPPPAAVGGKEKQQQHVLTACDDGKLRVVDGADGETLSETDLSSTCGRIKDAVLLHAPDADGSSSRRVVTASSDGKVVLWEIDAEGKEVAPGATGSIGEGVRITCLAAYRPWAGAGGEDGESEGAGGKKQKKRLKKKRAHDDGDGDGDGDAAAAVKKGGKNSNNNKKKQRLEAATPAPKRPSSPSPQAAAAAAGGKQQQQHQQGLKGKGKGKPAGAGGGGGGGGGEKKWRKEKGKGRQQQEGGKGGKKVKTKDGVVIF